MTYDENLISVIDFLHLSRFRERDLLQLLSSGELNLQLGPLGEVLIDISDLTPQRLAALAPQTGGETSGEDPVLAEAVASELVAALDPILDEALTLALRWYEAEEADD